jgi:putative NADH-flavin reductase
MNIALIGATGNVGSRILAEALRRSHSVTGIARNPDTMAPRAGLALVAGDVAYPAILGTLLAGHDAVVSSVRFQDSDPNALIGAVRQSGVKRYLVVGGAGSLKTGDGRLLLDAPTFPDVARAEAGGGKVFLDTLCAVEDLDWTMLSPSALITAGERTGVFRLGADELLTGADGKSWISYEDFAIALVDEIETPMHVRRRFTVGY